MNLRDQKLLQIYKDTNKDLYELFRSVKRQETIRNIFNTQDASLQDIQGLVGTDQKEENTKTTK